MNDKGLFEAIEFSWYEVIKWLASTPWGRVLEDQCLKRVYTGWMNGVLVTRLKDENVDDEIEDTKRFFAQHSRSWVWFLYPSTQPMNLGSYLERHGFKRSASSHPAMAMNLSGLRDEFLTPDSLDIKKITDDRLLNIWSKVFLVGHGLGHLLKDGSKVFHAVGVRDDQPATKYLGFYNGVPVASSQIFYGRDVTRLNFVSTMPEARGKGIATAISLASLRDAYDHGYKVAVLYSTDMGYSIYKKLGFKEVFKLHTYAVDSTMWD